MEEGRGRKRREAGQSQKRVSQSGPDWPTFGAWRAKADWANPLCIEGERDYSTSYYTILYYILYSPSSSSTSSSSSSYQCLLCIFRKRLSTNLFAHALQISSKDGRVLLTLSIYIPSYKYFATFLYRLPIHLRSPQPVKVFFPSSPITWRVAGISLFADQWEKKKT